MAAQLEAALDALRLSIERWQRLASPPGDSQQGVPTPGGLTERGVCEAARSIGGPLPEAVRSVLIEAMALRAQCQRELRDLKAREQELRLAESSSAAKERQLTLEEQWLREREKGIAERERDLSRRERDLKTREDEAESTEVFKPLSSTRSAKSRSFRATKSPLASPARVVPPQNPQAEPAPLNPSEAEQIGGMSKQWLQWCLAGDDGTSAQSPSSSSHEEKKKGEEDRNSKAQEAEIPQRTELDGTKGEEAAHDVAESAAISQQWLKWCLTSDDKEDAGGGTIAKIEPKPAALPAQCDGRDDNWEDDFALPNAAAETTPQKARVQAQAQSRQSETEEGFDLSEISDIPADNSEDARSPAQGLTSAPQQSATVTPDFGDGFAFNLDFSRVFSGALSRTNSSMLCQSYLDNKLSEIASVRQTAEQNRIQLNLVKNPRYVRAIFEIFNAKGRQVAGALQREQIDEREHANLQQFLEVTKRTVAALVSGNTRESLTRIITRSRQRPGPICGDCYVLGGPAFGWNVETLYEVCNVDEQLQLCVFEALEQHVSWFTKDLEAAIAATSKSSALCQWFRITLGGIRSVRQCTLTHLFLVLRHLRDFLDELVLSDLLYLRHRRSAIVECCCFLERLDSHVQSGEGPPPDTSVN